MKSFFTEYTSTGNYFAPLTGLRGLAAISVVFYHVFILLTPVTNSEYWFARHVILPIGAYGFLGVQLFFVLSGFLLSFYFLSAHRKGIKPSYLQFIKNRCLRVLPSYYFQLVFLTLLFFFLSLKEINIHNFVLHTLMLHNVDYRISGSINGVFWTLPIEWDFYYVLPFLAVLLTKKRWLWLFLSALIAGIGVRYILGELIISEDANLFLRIGLLTQIFSIPEYFIFGMIMAYWRYKISDDSVIKKLGDVVMLVGISTFFWSVSKVDWNTYWTSYQHYIWNSFASLALATFVLGASLNGWLARKLFTNKIMLGFGILSYGVYLWHLIIIDLIRGNYFKSINLLPSLEILNAYSITKLLLAAFIVFFLTLIVAYLNYRYIEKPFLSLKKSSKTST